MDYNQNEDFKVQRQKLVQSIRRQNRQSQFNKRRNPTVEVDLGNSDLSSNKNCKILIVDEQRRQAIEGFIKEKYFTHMFPALVKLLYSEDIMEKHQAIIGIRKILSQNDSPPISLVFQHNILPLIIECMKQSIYPHLKLQATWIISNIATGGPQDVASLVEYNIIPILTSFLFQNKVGIADQAIWAIGNLAGDSPALRDKVIDQGAVDSVIHFINNTTSKSNLVQAAWALSNLCRGNPLPTYQKVQKALPVLCKLVSLNILDDQNLSDCLWAISYTIQGPKQRMNAFLESKAIDRVIQCSKSIQLSISSPALRILGTVSTGSQQQTQQLLDHNILSVFQQLLQSKKSLVRRQVCWILSNIAAGTKNQVDQLLDNEKIIDKVLTLFELDSYEIKREICYIFANMVYLGDKNKIQNLLIKKEIMTYYAQCLIQRHNYKLIQNCLDTLPMLFDFGQKMRNSKEEVNFAIQSFLNHPGVIEGFDQLRQVENHRIYEKALKIYEKYFEIDNDDHRNNNMIEEI